jgi:hypothetical protein
MARGQHLFPADFALFQRLHEKDLAIVDQQEYRLACQHALEDLLRRRIPRGLRLLAQRCWRLAKVTASAVSASNRKENKGLGIMEAVCQLLKRAPPAPPWSLPSQVRLCAWDCVPCQAGALQQSLTSNSCLQCKE